MKRCHWIAIMVLALALATACKPAGSRGGHPLSKAAAEEAVLDWNMATTVEAYKKIGNQDRAWDNSALEALELFAALRSPQSRTNIELAESNLAKALRRAINAKCDDPLIGYLWLRSGGAAGKSEADAAAQLRQAADQLDASLYPTIRKFYGALRAARASKYINRQTPPEFYPYRQKVLDDLQLLARDASIPMEEVYQAFHEAIQSRFWGKKGIEELDNAVSVTLVKTRPYEALTYVIKGEHETQYGWILRGGGYINTVSADDFKGFQKHLNLAAKSLEKAWKLDPKEVRAAVAMLTVVRGGELGWQALELWFKRAMDLDPGNYEACAAKLEYLQPKWGGSPEAMLAFGRECVASPTWNGRVPLILVEAHYALSGYLPEGEARADYWKQPAVWPDIKASYEKFFDGCPEAWGYRHNYASYAYWCGQWDEFNKLLPQLVQTNYEFFGGQEAFDKMVATAKQRGTPKK